MKLLGMKRYLYTGVVSTDAYAGRGSSYFLKKDYGNALNDFQKAQALGAHIDPRIFELLRQKIGGEK